MLLDPKSLLLYVANKKSTNKKSLQGKKQEKLVWGGEREYLKYLLFFFLNLCEVPPSLWLSSSHSSGH